MNSSNTKLKPLDHKKTVNNQIPIQPQIGTKAPIKKTTVATTQEKKKIIDQPSQAFNNAYRKVSYTRSSNRPTTKVEQYECNDFDMPALEEEDAYFELQLQKNSKVQSNSQKLQTQKIIPKNQVVLPKLEGDQSIKQMKDIERQMDLQFSKMLDKQLSEDM